MQYFFLILFLIQSLNPGIPEAEEIDEFEVYTAEAGVAEEYLDERIKEEGERTKMGVRSVGMVRVAEEGDSVVGTWRYRIRVNRYSHWEARFLAEQDHRSGGFVIRPGGGIRQALIGDYQVNEGFGVVIGSAPEFSAGLYQPATLSMIGRGIRLHPGTDRDRFLRGVALSAGGGSWSVEGFYSGRSCVASGDTVPVEAAGLCAGVRHSRFEAGAGLVRIRRDSLQVPPGDWVPAREDGYRHIFRVGAWGQLRLSCGILFGEGGISADGGGAGVAGFRLFEQNGFSSVIRVSTATADYPVYLTRFQSGQTPVSSRTQVNWSGVYAFKKGFTWFGSATYAADASPGGSKFITPGTRLSQRLTWQGNKAPAFSATINADFGQRGEGLADAAVIQLRVDSNTERNGAFRITGTLQQSFRFLETDLLKGSALNLTAFLSNPSGSLRLITGIHLFTMESSASPLYCYEPDLLYGFSAPVLTGSGSRIYALIKWKISAKLTLEAKIYQVNYQDYKHITEGSASSWGGKVQVVLGV